MYLLLLLLLLLLQGVSRPAAKAPVTAVRLQRRSQQPHAVGYEARAVKAQPALPPLPLRGPGCSVRLYYSFLQLLGPLAPTWGSVQHTHSHPAPTAILCPVRTSSRNQVWYLPYDNCR